MPARVAHARVISRVDRLLLARQLRERVRLARCRPPAGCVTSCQSVSPAQPGRDQRLHRLVGTAELVDVLAEPDLGRPFAELGAARDIERRHAVSSRDSRRESDRAVSALHKGGEACDGFS